ncbi:hypothetical protein BGX28_009751 [Mortierella sp. GBA30]|nr:hypothetical protein BGX28_009751 [Mortierella sp. GBA30]
MRLSLTLGTIATALVLACTSQVEASVAAAYLLINPETGPARLKALADNAANIPINRLFISFARPDLVYKPDSHTLKDVGLNYNNKDPDFGFDDLKKQVTKLRAGGVEVFLSVGGWNYGCFPYLYTYFSIAEYGKGPNFYKITDYGGGSVSGCNESNMWCYTCEPKDYNTTLADFNIFPEPDYSPTWKQAVEYVVMNTKGEAPQFNPAMIPGTEYLEPKTKTKIQVPGRKLFYDLQRDPYQDLVYLGKDLGLTGVDIDYEEMWHADYTKAGPKSGPWTNHQTTYKYTAIMRDVQINIQAIAPTLKLGTASAAVGAQSGDWWGGNLKTVWFNMYAWYPEVYNFAAKGANAGGVNVMTYDLSSNMEFWECPNADLKLCPLNKQVSFYMQTYKDAKMEALVGYEIGRPAYPAYDHDKEHQLPLTNQEFNTIIGEFGPQGGFFWELYKQPQGADNIDAVHAAQRICKAALGENEQRCSGTIPGYKAVSDPVNHVDLQGWFDDFQEQLPFNLRRFRKWGK